MEEVGLIVEFIERIENFQGVKNKNTKEQFILKVTEEGSDDVIINEEWRFESWAELKEECPTFKDLLVMIHENYHWNSAWRDYDRIIYAKKISGYEGIYNDKEITYKLNCFEESEESEEFEE
jgi:hypothetical protein